MRRALLLFALAAPAVAQDPAETDGETERPLDVAPSDAVSEAVIKLVAELGDPNVWIRSDAHELLRSMGEEIFPALRAMDPANPEARRRIRALLRRSRRLHLEANGPVDPLPIGSPLRLQAVLMNETEEAYAVSLVGTSDRGTGTLSSFHLVIDGEMRTLTPDQVTVGSPQEPWIALRPGDGMSVEILLAGEEAPFRGPGTLEVEVVFETARLLRRFDGIANPQDVQQETISVRVASKPMRLAAVGRGARELQQALDGGDREARAGALAELRLREDAAMLPLLRARLKDRDLRLWAVQRLAGAAQAEDLPAILEATADGEATVRLAAVQGLASFPGKEARRRLARIAREDDHELIGAAVRSLTRHKHEGTIATFLELLKHNYRDGAWLQDIHDALWEWTGLHVNCTRSAEIEDFAEWWLRNREEWTRSNPDPK